MKYPPDFIDPNEDDGTIVDNVADLELAVVGHKITGMYELGEPKYGDIKQHAIMLDNGTMVRLENTSHCCAFTELNNFLLHPEMVDHIITGVATTDGATTWHIYADMGDVLTLTVGWSAGNPFYYGYGFNIQVSPLIEGDREKIEGNHKED